MHKYYSSYKIKQRYRYLTLLIQEKFELLILILHRLIQEIHIYK